MAVEEHARHGRSNAGGHTLGMGKRDGFWGVYIHPHGARTSLAAVIPGVTREPRRRVWVCSLALSPQVLIHMVSPHRAARTSPILTNQKIPLLAVHRFCRHILPTPDNQHHDDMTTYMIYHLLLTTGRAHSQRLPGLSLAEQKVSSPEEHDPPHLRLALAPSSAFLTMPQIFVTDSRRPRFPDVQKYQFPSPAPYNQHHRSNSLRCSIPSHDALAGSRSIYTLSPSIRSETPPPVTGSQAALPACATPFHQAHAARGELIHTYFVTQAPHAHLRRSLASARGTLIHTYFAKPTPARHSTRARRTSSTIHIPGEGGVCLVGAGGERMIGIGDSNISSFWLALRGSRGRISTVYVSVREVLGLKMSIRVPSEIAIDPAFAKAPRSPLASITLLSFRDLGAPGVNSDVTYIRTPGNAAHAFLAQYL
ncbi:hypothetical protein DFP72DRAFT_853807 [Ephemerocybe angulata]|uniref:Uncharacterized protein n=1 Tax=Ephemerocybe angulata TaxID=980116 RepID=A0A8H6LXX9_9AGAR|nr:hypothetical protein DFP72DRAFT_853807 [Tulosesus angulatus]